MSTTESVDEIYPSIEDAEVMRDCSAEEKSFSPIIKSTALRPKVIITKHGTLSPTVPSRESTPSHALIFREDSSSPRTPTPKRVSLEALPPLRESPVSRKKRRKNVEKSSNEKVQIRGVKRKRVTKRVTKRKTFAKPQRRQRQTKDSSSSPLGSPLPDLIIETMPKRQHEEPQEVYDALLNSIVEFIKNNNLFGMGFDEGANRHDSIQWAEAMMYSPVTSRSSIPRSGSGYRSGSKSSTVVSPKSTSCQDVTPKESSPFPNSSFSKEDVSSHRESTESEVSGGVEEENSAAYEDDEGEENPNQLSTHEGIIETPGFLREVEVMRRDSVTTETVSPILQSALHSQIITRRSDSSYSTVYSFSKIVTRRKQYSSHSTPLRSYYSPQEIILDPERLSDQLSNNSNDVSEVYDSEEEEEEDEDEETVTVEILRRGVKRKTRDSNIQKSSKSSRGTRDSIEEEEEEEMINSPITSRSSIPRSGSGYRSVSKSPKRTSSRDFAPKEPSPFPNSSSSKEDVSSHRESSGPEVSAGEEEEDRASSEDREERAKTDEDTTLEESVNTVLQCTSPILQASPKVLQTISSNSQMTQQIIQTSPILQAAPNILQTSSPNLQATRQSLQETSPILQAAPNILQTTSSNSQMTPQILQTSPILQAGHDILQTSPNLQATRQSLQVTSPISQADPNILRTTSPNLQGFGQSPVLQLTSRTQTTYKSSYDVTSKKYFPSPSTSFQQEISPIHITSHQQSNESEVSAKFEDCNKQRGTMDAESPTESSEASKLAVTSKASQSEEASEAFQSDEVSKASQSDEASKASQSDEVSKASQSEEASKAFLSDEVSKASQSEETPKASQSEEASKASQSDEASKVSQSEEALKASQSEEASKASQSDEASKVSQSEEALKASQSEEASKASQSDEASKASQIEERSDSGETAESAEAEPISELNATTSDCSSHVEPKGLQRRKLHEINCPFRKKTKEESIQTLLL